MKKSFLSLIVFLSITSFVFTTYTADAAQNNRHQAQKKQLAGESAKSRKAKTSRRSLQPISKNPYLGAIVIDAATNKVLFEDNADAKGYPASVVKLMNFLIILEALEAKEISLQDKITVSAEAAKIGGSQVYLREMKCIR